MIPFNCKCKDYCDFLVVLTNEEVQKEVCTRCGRSVIYNKVDGKIDNRKYLRDHVRDFCQPFGATADVFLKVYGEKALVFSRKKHKEHAEKAEKAERAISDGIAEALEDLRIWKRLSSHGMTEAEITRELYKSNAP